MPKAPPLLLAATVPALERLFAPDIPLLVKASEKRIEQMILG